MKIQVDRTEPSDNTLVFTITVSQPLCVPFTEEDIRALVAMDMFMLSMSQTLDTNGEVYKNLISANHSVKEKILEKVLASMRFHIECVLKKKFKPMCEEIYNWVYDHQEGHVKSWLSTFTPERTKYYFDNDRKDESIQDDACECDDDDEDSEC